MRLSTRRLDLETVEVSEAHAAPSGERDPDWADDYPTEGDLVIARLVADNPIVSVGAYLRFKIIVRDSRQVVGRCGYLGLPDAPWSGAIGYGLALSPRGKGFATEAVQALTAQAWRESSVRMGFAVTDRDKQPLTVCGSVPASRRSTRLASSSAGRSAGPRRYRRLRIPRADHITNSPCMVEGGDGCAGEYSQMSLERALPPALAPSGRQQLHDPAALSRTVGGVGSPPTKVRVALTVPNRPSLPMTVKVPDTDCQNAPVAYSRNATFAVPSFVPSDD
jgi:[ribosomal protein S5]-alanine N-acetyltransferase